MSSVKAFALLLVLFLHCLPVLTAESITQFMSPFVSYQYPEDMSLQALMKGGMSSPFGSYVYLEWPNDDILALKSSPILSYLYNWDLGAPASTLHGQVRTASGEPLQGATVTASVFGGLLGEVTSREDGSYAFPTLAADVYEVRAQKDGFIPSQRILSLSPATAWQSFGLLQLASPPNMATAGSTALVAQEVSDPLRGARLRAFGTSGFREDAHTVSQSAITIVLTHGWNASADGTTDAWPVAMARAMRDTVGLKPNIVAWDWQRAASANLPPVERTPGQGLALGMELRHLLGAQYDRPIHFVGHSLGTLVNARAANYLHGTVVDRVIPPSPAWAAEKTHMTLLDDAAIANVGGKALVYASVGARSARPDEWLRQHLVDTYQTARVKPLPEYCGWADNYVSAVGFFQPRAVNVCLQNASILFSENDWLDSVATMHRYAVDWYKDSVLSHTGSTMGFINSWERSLLLTAEPGFPPAYANGATFLQDQSGTDPHGPHRLRVVPAICDNCPPCNAPALSMMYSDLRAGGTVSWPTTEGTVLQTGAVVIQRVVRQALPLSYGYWLVGQQLSDVTRSVVDLMNVLSDRIELRTGPPSGGSGRLMRQENEPLLNNTPAYVWFTLEVPEDAVSLVFDYAVTGDPDEDYLACGINGQTRFTMQGKFRDSSEVATSPPIDVSASAGSTIEMFFGVVGGTATNCTVTIEGIRFVSFSLPTLSIAGNGNVTLLSWPTSAYDYSLETATNLARAAWTTVVNSPTISGGQYVLTNLWSGQTRFFRLRRD